ANESPTADFVECSTPAEANHIIDNSTFPVVIKADGLAAGKGVVIAESDAEARDAIHQFMESRTLGEAGSRLVIEDFLQGEEASCHVFADRSAFQRMVAGKDHKRRYGDDKGPNSDGMGAY